MMILILVQYDDFLLTVGNPEPISRSMGVRFGIVPMPVSPAKYRVRVRMYLGGSGGPDNEGYTGVV